MSGLNLVEVKLSAIARQRSPTLGELTAHVAACVAQRSAAQNTVHLQFALKKACAKFDRHYWGIREVNSPDQAPALPR